MGWWLYTVEGQQKYWGLTPLPDLDREWFLHLGYRHFAIKAGPLPYGEASFRWKRQPSLIPLEGEGETDFPLLSMLAGHLLRERDIERVGSRAGLGPAEIRAGLHSAWLQGKVERFRAFEVEGGGYRCQRCGSRTGIREEWCPACGRRLCPVCLDCAVLGALRDCEPLYRFPSANRGGITGTCRACPAPVFPRTALGGRTIGSMAEGVLTSGL